MPRGGRQAVTAGSAVTCGSKPAPRSHACCTSLNQAHTAARGDTAMGRTARAGGDDTCPGAGPHQVFDVETVYLFCDLAEEANLDGSEGGAAASATHTRDSTNRAPRYHQQGSPAEEGLFVQLELKLLPRGLVGFRTRASPALSTVSAARPKIAIPSSRRLSRISASSISASFGLSSSRTPPSSRAPSGGGLGTASCATSADEAAAHLVYVSSVPAATTARTQTINRELRCLRCGDATPADHRRDEARALDEPYRGSAARAAAATDWKFTPSPVCQPGRARACVRLGRRLDELKELRSRHEIGCCGPAWQGSEVGGGLK